MAGKEQVGGDGGDWKFLVALAFIVTLLAEPHVPMSPPAKHWPGPRLAALAPPASPHLAGELALGQADLWPLSHLQVSPRASPSHSALNPLPDNHRDGWGWLLPENGE